MEPVRRGWRWDVAWMLCCVSVSSIWCITAAKQLGATADEAPYLRMGLERWRTGSHGPLMAVGTMPLAIDVQTFPLYLAERWRGTPHELDSDLPKVLPKLLPWARAGTLLFWWALLVYGWLIGRRLAGRWGGRLAVALLACEPNLLAHACLATTDIAVSACTLALTYHFFAGRERGWLLRVGVPAVCFGALLLAKASAVVFGPICLAVVGLAWVANRSLTVQRPLRSLALDVPQVLAIGFVLALFYIGSDWRPSEMVPSQTAQKLPPGLKRDALEAYGRLPIFCNLTEGILFQVFQNTTGTPAYLFGEVHPKPGVWYYFPVALSMKLPVPLLVLPVLVVIVRPRALANWAFLLAVVLLALSVTYRVQNGIRLVLPLVALWAVGLAVVVVRAREAVEGVSRWLVSAAVIVAGSWMAASTATAWPDGLRYFNEFWRGQPGYQYLNDSNYDWGQGLKPLDRWHRKNGRPPMKVWTFGNDPAFRLMPVEHCQLDALNLAAPQDHLPVVRGHYLAASALLVYGYWDTSAVRFLRQRQPVAQAGTYLIYDFTQVP
ncbi:MAG: glycosyltransferase family 39 protein [Planctomycetia bacterium]|nr:glycosyltransferase family 39 protein [Planctomycetia bacterium]